MEDQTDVIKESMKEKRAELSEKLQHLERHVTGEVASTAGSVTESVANVAGGMQDTITSVRDLFDLPKQVQDHPWLAVGGAVVVGFLANEYLKQNNPLASLGAAVNGAMSNGKSANGQSGLASLFGGEMFNLQRFATLAALQLVGRAVKESIPGPTGEGLGQIVDRFAATLEEPAATDTAKQPSNN